MKKFFLFAALLISCQLLFSQEKCEVDLTSLMLAFCTPEPEEDQEREYENIKYCQELVQSCNGDLSCISKIDVEIADVLGKRITKRGGRVHDGLMALIKQALTGLTLATERKGDGQYTFKVIGNNGNIVFSRVLPKVATGIFSSPASPKVLTNKQIQQLCKGKKAAARQKIILGMFNYVSITVSPVYKNAQK